MTLNRKRFFSMIAGLFAASKAAPAVSEPTSSLGELLTGLVDSEPTSSLGELLTGLVEASYRRYPQLLLGKTVNGVFVPDELPDEG